MDGAVVTFSDSEQTVSFSDDVSKLSTSDFNKDYVRTDSKLSARTKNSHFVLKSSKNRRPRLSTALLGFTFTHSVTGFLSARRRR